MGAAASFAGALSALPAVAVVFACAHVEDRFAHTNFVRVYSRIRSPVCSHSLACLGLRKRNSLDARDAERCAYTRIRSLVSARASPTSTRSHCHLLLMLRLLPLYHTNHFRGANACRPTNPCTAIINKGVSSPFTVHRVKKLIWRANKFL